MSGLVTPTISLIPADISAQKNTEGFPVTAGQTITLTGTAAPGELVNVGLAGPSSSTLGKQVTAGPNGSFSYTVTLPQIALNQHYFANARGVTASGASTGFAPNVYFCVTPPQMPTISIAPANISGQKNSEGFPVINGQAVTLTGNAAPGELVNVGLAGPSSSTLGQQVRVGPTGSFSLTVNLPEIANNQHYFANARGVSADNTESTAFAPNVYFCVKTSIADGTPVAYNDGRPGIMIIENGQRHLISMVDWLAIDTPPVTLLPAAQLDAIPMGANYVVPAALEGSHNSVGQAPDGSFYALNSSGQLWHVTGDASSAMLDRIPDVVSATVVAHQNAATGAVTVELDDVQLNVNAVVSSVVSPILGAVQSAIAPLVKVATALNQPIPVVSTMASKAGLGTLTYANLFTDLTNGNQSVNTFVNDVLAAQNATSLAAAAGTVDIGSYLLNVSSGKASLGAVLSLKSVTNLLGGALGTELRSLQGVGLDFPILDNPEFLFLIAQGFNLPLFKYSLPDLALSNTYSMNFDFPTPVPGVTAQVGVAFGYHFDVGATIACNSSGLLSGNPLSGFSLQNTHVDAGVTATLSGGVYAGCPEFDLGGWVHANGTFGFDIEAALTDGPNGSTTIPFTDLKKIHATAHGVLTENFSVTAGVDYLFNSSSCTVYSTPTATQTLF